MHAKQFVAYIMGGPEFIAQLKALDEVGADYVEIGIPFSDPVADGPIIMEARTGGDSARDDGPENF